MAGQQKVTVYCDGAYRGDAQHGAWGFYVPLYAYESSSSGEGDDSCYFELLAALRGVKWVVANHRGRYCIEIRTDNLYVIHWVRELTDRVCKRSRATSMPYKYSIMLHELQELIETRPIFTAKVNSKTDASHMRCHTLATGALALAIHSKTEVKKRVETAHPNGDHLANLFRARTALLVRLAGVDGEIGRTLKGPSRWLWKYFRWVLVWRMKGMKHGK